MKPFETIFETINHALYLCDAWHRVSPSAQQQTNNFGLTSRLKYISNENRDAETNETHFIYTHTESLKVCETEETMLYRILGLWEKSAKEHNNKAKPVLLGGKNQFH